MAGQTLFDNRHQATHHIWDHTGAADFVGTPARARHDLVGSDRLPLRTLLLRHARSDVLAVHLHGSLDRERYDLPRFERLSSLQDLPYHQLFVSDPTLTLDDRMRIGWFIGKDGDDVIQAIADVVNEARSQLGVARVVLVGASAGGFAALALTPRIPGSLAVAISPQTNVGRFSNGSQARLLATAGFPRYGSYEELEAAEPSRVDIATCYAERPGGRVWYVQNTGDADHIERHMQPLRQAADDRITFLHEYHCAGHGAATVTRTRAWVRRACEHFDEDPSEFCLPATSPTPG